MTHNRNTIRLHALAALALLASAVAAIADVPPVMVTNVLIRKYGEEARSIVFPDGQLYWDADHDALCIGDGETPGGKYVCPHYGKNYDIDWHVFHKTLQVNGNDIQFNQFWTQVAEGGSLVYRFDTNSWLRLVGTTSGTLANLAIDDYDPTNGVMVVTADATNNPVLQVSTNLLAADTWQTATNATVTATTDASTTWTIALLGADAEFYRVLAEVALPAGIHAERTLHAKEGIEMGGETWDAWPDVGSIATNAANAAVEPVSERVGVLESAVWSDLYVQWPSSILSTSEVNWIPTNWPARSIVVNIAMGSMTNLMLGIPGGWNPDEDCMITFRVLRGASSGSLSVCIGQNNVNSPITSGTARYVFAFRWLAAPKTWVLWRWTLSYSNAVFDSEGNNKETTGIPEGARFAPTTNNPVAPSLAMSPSLSPLSPAVLQPVEELAVEGPGEEVDELGFEEETETETTETTEEMR